MSDIMECHLKLCHLEWNATQNKISFQMDFHSKWNVTHNGMSLKMECHLKWNVT